jgi:cyclopropane-fatty-acyl-phospholipid synthase
MHHIVWGKTFHRRYVPIDHRFEYAMTMVNLSFDRRLMADDSGVLQPGLFPTTPFPKGFLYSFTMSEFQKGGSPFEIHPFCSAHPLSGKSPGLFFSHIDGLLREHLGDISWDRVTFLTIPQLVFRPFKPVSFYFIYAQDVMVAMVAEVTNTYREKKRYVMSVEQGRSSAEKTFHVSPFFTENGVYHFDVRYTSFPKGIERASALAMHIAIDYRVDGESVFLATFGGRLLPMTMPSLLLSTLRATALPIWTLPRIYFQAAKLVFLKGLTAMQKPPLAVDQAAETMPLSWFQRRVQDRLFAVLRRLKKGALIIVEPDGKEWFFGSSDDGVSPVRLHIYHQWFYRRVAIGGEIGFGEAYVDGYWGSPDLPALLSFFVQNRNQLTDMVDGHFFQFFLDKLGHLRRENTVKNSKENIQAHYDLGNAFYDLFLDADKVYSSAVFDSEHASLDEAQQRKLDMIIAKARIAPHHHVLEIGSGWGALAIRMAQTTGCRVTTITLSSAQKEEVEAKIVAAGLSDRIEVRLQDFRHVRGTFDRIVSVEMLEAVGHRYLGTFFAQLESLLGPTGIAVLQVITYPDYAYAGYLKGTDFIRKHIFPGGHLPSVAALTAANAKNSQLVLEHLENLGPHYARTLALWRHNLDSRESEALALGFDAAFIRKFRYYFAYCEAAFSARYLGVHQLVLSRSFNVELGELS